MKHHHQSQMNLYSYKGQRLYLNVSERVRFADCARKQEPHITNLCLCLLYTGCRVSEAINLTGNDLQIDEKTISIKSLKKRGASHIREVPIPQPFALQLQSWTNNNKDQKLWSINRATAWRWIKMVMLQADIYGQQATPKGLRHSFGINAVMNYVPLNVLQKWMGHADMGTTAIYAQVKGPEERALAERMW